jgi:hypothetical protein
MAAVETDTAKVASIFKIVVAPLAAYLEQVLARQPKG